MNTKDLTAVVVSVSVLLSVAMFIRVQDTLIDVAFITYRYSANFAEGNGLVYNTGERVMGTTTPLYALLLGVGGFI